MPFYFNALHSWFYLTSNEKCTNEFTSLRMGVVRIFRAKNMNFRARMQNADYMMLFLSLFIKDRRA